AGVVAALALFIARTGPMTQQPFQAQVAPADRGDEIFNGSLDHSVAHQAGGDHIFRAGSDDGNDRFPTPRGG
ncbi:MAG TPA: hypothetical protein VN153_00635, partial [Tahibacter sp.]|nr:hypothetical protein [Tahibacter sp.]